MSKAYFNSFLVTRRGPHTCVILYKFNTSEIRNNDLTGDLYFSKYI